MRSILFLALVVLSAPLWLTACRSSGSSAEVDGATLFRNVAEGAAYVGDEACAQCHEEAYRGYQAHGMAQSFYRLTPENAVEDYAGVTLRHEPTGFYYTAYREGDRFVQEEYRLGADGRKTHRLVRAMEYVVGSGSAARTYLTEEGGRLYELPLTWYTQAEDGQGRWDFSPGYRESNGRFDRAIPPRCMACHNGTSEPVPFVEGMYREVALGIGCEQCHGPGALHVEARLADPEAPDSVDYTIVNPRHLALDRRLDVCQQCHTSGAVSILREGEAAFGYRPSRPLEEHVAIFALDTETPGRIGVISHADRMRQSACFTESQTMDCVTCHNPHEGFRDAGPAYFNQTCQDCHAVAPLQAQMPTPELRVQHAATANCFDCHMPKVLADDAPHASFTDHRIRIVRDDQLEGAAVEAPGSDLNPYFERDREGAEAEVYQGMAYVVYGRQQGSRAAMTRGIRLLEEALDEQPGFGEAQYLLGFARLQLGQARAALPALEAAVAAGPDVPERLNTLAQALEQTGGALARIETLYRRALEIQPLAADIRVNLGRFLETQGRAADALAAYRRAAEDAPTLVAAHYNLGTALLRAGDAGAGAAALREAIRLNPLHADALSNLGVLLASQGDLRQGRTYLERAVEADPQNANALANLALTLANLGDAAGARQRAEQALSLDPNQPTARQVLAALS